MRTAALSLLLLAAVAPACLNDRDTLIREAQSPPGVLTALTGRFERLPPAYYEARIARLRRLARPSPEELDDLGVALDRLGRDDEALAAMARKAGMPGLDREARYRLHANRGTFLAHRALATKAPVSALIPAIADIEAAIRLKPDAHFGREGVQLRVLSWIYAHRTDPKTPDLGTVLATEGDPAKTATALAGLIELGNAWESPDVVAAIARLLPEIDEEAELKSSTLTEEVRVIRRAGAYARLRYAELEAKGIRPLDSEAKSAFVQRRELPPEDQTSLKDAWNEARAAAERRVRSRAEFALAGLAAGRHPDTDPAFWRGWRESTEPTRDQLLERRLDLEKARVMRRLDKEFDATFTIAKIVIGIVIALILVAILMRMARPRRPSGLSD